MLKTRGLPFVTIVVGSRTRTLADNCVLCHHTDVMSTLQNSKQAQKTQSVCNK